MSEFVKDAICIVCGTFLIIGGILDYHIQPGAILIGLLLIGVVSVDKVREFLEVFKR